MSIEAHSFITIPFETHHETQASILQCLKEPSHAQRLKDLCTQDHKSRNHVPKRIFQSKQLGYLRWRNIFLEGYQILKKKGWKGLVGHPSDWGKCSIFFYFFYFPHFIFESFSFLSFYLLSFYFILFYLFLTSINLLMFVPVKINCCYLLTGVLVFKFGGRPSFCTLRFPHPTVLYLLTHWGQCVI